jgi:lysophospholipase L1-like esterase
MSWELFRQNVLNVVSQPENINNIKLVARTYATEYDACIRRGGDLINKIPLVKGDVIGMTRIFERALSNGLNSRVPYDLTGEMGKGVIQYWTNAQLSIITPPVVTFEQIAASATANLVASSNVVIKPGVWKSTKSQAPAPPPTDSTDTNKKSKDTTAKRIESDTKEFILFVGDSITAGSISYPMVIAKKHPNIVVDVLAIGGKTTGWMLDNLPNKLASTKYNKVYIYGGVNDSFNDSISTQRALSNVQKMVDLINESGAKAIVIIGYNTDTATDYTKIPTTIYVKDKKLYIPMIEKYKKYQQLLKTDIKNAEFIGKFEIGKLSDGLHPSKSQYETIANIVKNAL